MMNKCRNTNKICRFSENGRRKKKGRKVLKRADDVSSARAGPPRGRRIWCSRIQPGCNCNRNLEEAIGTSGREADPYSLNQMTA